MPTKWINDKGRRLRVLCSFQATHISPWKVRKPKWHTSGASISAWCAKEYWWLSIWNTYATCMYKCNTCCRNMWEVECLNFHIPWPCICPGWIWNFWTIKGDICKTCKGMVSQKRNPSSLENSRVGKCTGDIMGHDSQLSADIVIWLIEILKLFLMQTMKVISVVFDWHDDVDRDSSVCISGKFITFYICVGCCTECISQQRHFCIANEYQS